MSEPRVLRDDGFYQDDVDRLLAGAEERFKRPSQADDPAEIARRLAAIRADITQAQARVNRTFVLVALIIVVGVALITVIAFA